MTLWLVNQRVEQEHAVALLSGEITVQQRMSVLDRFREGKEKFWLQQITNVLSRSIDIEQVTIVINFYLPVTVTHKPDYDTYLHRIGHTGCFSKKGIAINLVSGHSDHILLKHIEEHFCKAIECLNANDMEELGAED